MNKTLEGTGNPIINRKQGENRYSCLEDRRGEWTEWYSNLFAANELWMPTIKVLNINMLAQITFNDFIYISVIIFILEKYVHLIAINIRLLKSNYIIVTLDNWYLLFYFIISLLINLDEIDQNEAINLFFIFFFAFACPRCD